MRIVILGCGRVGATLATWLVREGHDVTIIDRETTAFNRLEQDFNKRGRTVSGDGIDEDVLIRAGIKEADGFAAVTNGDNRNIMAAQIAQYRFHVPKVICRIYDRERQDIYNKLGLNSISPTVIGARFIKDALLPGAGPTTNEDLALASGVSVPVTRLDDERIARSAANPQDTREQPNPTAGATRPSRP